MKTSLIKRLSDARISNKRNSGGQKTIRGIRFNFIRVFTLQWKSYLPLLLILLSSLLFFNSLNKIDLAAMSDYGLISILPFSTFFAIAVLSISFIYSLSQPDTRTWIFALHILLLIFMLYGITIIIEEVPRFNVTWRHLGIVDYVLRYGNVQDKIDAYFEWPGFFIFNALLTSVTGWESLVRVVSWSTILFNVLYLGAMLMIFQSITKDKRLIWLSIWFFYITNWIGQDYFSPQGLNYFFYLIVIGALLLWFRQKPNLPWLDKSIQWVRQRFNQEKEKPEIVDDNAENDINRQNPVQQSGIFVIMLLILFVMIASHQLTPFALLASLLALTLFKQLSLRNFVIIAGLLLLTWLSFAAVAYLKGHIGIMLDNIGEISAVINRNLTNRILGNEAHLFILKIRLFFTVFVWLVALYGVIRTLQKGVFDLSIALLAAVPFGLIALQTYGGEMLLRIFLFTLPFIAFFAASLFYPTINDKGNWKWSLAIGVVSVIFITGFFFARYGDEKIYQYTANEVRAVHVLDQIAEEDSLVLAPSPKYPGKFENYEKYRYRYLINEIIDRDLKGIINTVSGSDKDAYFIITNSQISYFNLYAGFPPEAWADLEQQMIESERFYLTYANEDAKIYKYIR